jgi:hypothetical protein
MMFRVTTQDNEPIHGELLPAEYPDGTWLHLPDLHGTGYTEVVRRDDAEGHNDHPRPDRHWWAYHQGAWLDWPQVVRLGGASSQAYVLVRLTPATSGYFGGAPQPPAEDDPWPGPGSPEELYAELVAELGSDEWADQHFGLAAHAHDVAGLVMGVVWPQIAQLHSVADLMGEKLSTLRDLTDASGIPWPWPRRPRPSRPLDPERFPH